jgi:hypothetical protein
MMTLLPFYRRRQFSAVALVAKATGDYDYAMASEQQLQQQLIG